jgi:hypothetical protein
MKRRRVKDDATPRNQEDLPDEPSSLQMLSGMLGAGLVLLALLVMRQERWTLTLLDGMFWGAAAAFLAARQVALAKARKHRPPRVRLMRAVVALGVATAMWVVAQAIGTPPV